MIVCPDITAFISAWQANSSHTFLFIVWARPRIVQSARDREDRISPGLDATLKMAPAPLSESKGFSIRRSHHDVRRSGLEAADPGNCHAARGCRLKQQRLARRRHRQQQLVIVAAGPAGLQPALPRRPSLLGQWHLRGLDDRSQPAGAAEMAQVLDEPVGDVPAGAGYTADRQAHARLGEPVTSKQEPARISDPSGGHRETQSPIADGAGDPDAVAVA